MVARCARGGQVVFTESSWDRLKVVMQPYVAALQVGAASLASCICQLHLPAASDPALLLVCFVQWQPDPDGVVVLCVQGPLLSLPAHSKLACYPVPLVITISLPPVPQIILGQHTVSYRLPLALLPLPL